MRSASARAIVQAIVDGVTDPVEAVTRATYYANHVDMPERQAKYQRLLDALTALPHLSQPTRRVLGAIAEGRCGETHTTGHPLSEKSRWPLVSDAEILISSK